MRKLTVEFITAIALTLAAIIASAAGARASDVMVINAFARASATPAARAGAAYVTVVNHGDTPDRLIAIVTPAASMAEVHGTVMNGNVIKMETLDAVNVPAQASVEMKPGGLHVMLMGLKKPLVEGGAIDMTLTFEKAGSITIKVPVREAAASGP